MSYFNMLKRSLQIYILSETRNITKEEIILSNYIPNLEEEKIAERHLIYKEPLSKIFQKKYFWNYCWKTNKNTLDPRPQTEKIIELLLKNHDVKEKFSILELGIGTGCVIGTILKLFPLAKGTGIEISKKAIKIAKENFRNLNIKCQVICSDWLESINKHFDILVSNPPYLLEEEYKKNLKTLQYDPKISLVPKDPLFFYRKIAEKQNLFKEIYLEVPKKRIRPISKLFSKDKLFLV